MVWSKVPEWHVQWHVFGQLEPHQLHPRQHLRTTQQLPKRAINTNRGERRGEQCTHRVFEAHRGRGPYTSDSFDRWDTSFFLFLRMVYIQMYHL